MTYHSATTIVVIYSGKDYHGRCIPLSASMLENRIVYSLKASPLRVHTKEKEDTFTSTEN